MLDKGIVIIPQGFSDALAAGQPETNWRRMRDLRKQLDDLQKELGDKAAAP